VAGATRTQLPLRKKRLRNNGLTQGDAPMTTTVFLAVIAAAFMHAAWNALVKSGSDRLVGVMSIAAGQGLVATLLLPVVASPRPQAVGWIVVSGALHAAYKLFLMQAYRVGDMGQVYPLARGAAPLLTGAVGVLALGEYLTSLQTVGLCAVGVGVMAMGLRGAARFEAAPVALSLATAGFISAYTLVDGHGARINGGALSFIVWMHVVDTALCLAAGYALAGRTLTARLAAQWPTATAGGALSIASYTIATWAMTQAPIALVAALRETSVLFALGISVLILREPALPARLAAGLVIVAGLGLMRAA
jgi:drug/metabolite transporter (DMT)-like permease